MLYFVSEAAVRGAVDQAMVTTVIEQVFKAQGTGHAWNFPVVRESLNHAEAIFGFKAAFDKAAPALSVKAGGLWPGNRERGLPNHLSLLKIHPQTLTLLTASIHNAGRLPVAV